MINNKKILIVIIVVVMCITTYFLYTKDKNDIGFISNTIVENVQEEANLNEEVEEKTQKIVIYVSGEVINPGVYNMNIDDRISDAIEKAGGLTEKANIKDLNLAYLLEDGMKIYIPNIDEVQNDLDNSNYEENEHITIDSSANSKSNANLNKKININTASQSDLETLPGIGETTAQKIINYRKENGRFSKIEDIKNIKGIGDAKFSKIKDLITI